MGATTRSRFGAGSGTVAAVILAATVAAPGVAAGEIRISMDRGRELQRLLDAAADAGSAPPDAAPPAPAVVSTPFPGIGADPGSSPLPERWRRDRRRP